MKALVNKRLAGYITSALILYAIWSLLFAPWNYRLTYFDTVAAYSVACVVFYSSSSCVKEMLIVRMAIVLGIVAGVAALLIPATVHP